VNAIAYALDLAVDADARAVTGRCRMSFARSDAGADLALDYRGDVPAAALAVNGVQGLATRVDATLRVPARALRTGRNELEMPVAGTIAPSGTPLLRHEDAAGDVYIYSLFVPAEASALFPCLDRPDAKARFRLRLRVPPAWTAVSCAPVVRRDDGCIEFGETPPLSTYAFAFAAGPWAAIDDAPASPPARAFIRRSAGGDVRDGAIEALRLAREAMAWGEGFFGMAFPFAKHDLVVIPAFPFGGMEHAGATFLDEGAVAPSGPAGEGARRRRAQLVHHETVHQWLGDCVTMRGFEDLWLKEGFANLGALLVGGACDATLQSALGMHRLKMAAVRQDLSAGAVAVRRPVAHAADAKSLYGPGVYGKAPALLRQARHLLGPSAFDRGVRTFVARHAYGAATCDDLGAALATADAEMGDWLHAWLDVACAPTIRMALEASGSRLTGARVVREDRAPSAAARRQRLEAIAIRTDGTARRTAVLLDAGSVELAEWRGDPVPLIAFANAGDHGYGRFLLDPASREAALEHLDRVAEPLLRLQLVEALWEDVRDAALDPARFVAFAHARLAGVEEWGVAAAILEHAEASLRWLPAAERRGLRPVLEAARRGLGLVRPVPQDPACAALLALATSTDPADKARCFDAMLHDAALPERWIEAAAERFNDLDHAVLTLPYLRPALDALPTLAATRRIFFVDRWLAAFFAGQGSEAALAVVAQFLAEGALAGDLRQKVVGHADELARTVRIRRRYARGE
jgi:aminopeptidase N